MSNINQEDDITYYLSRRVLGSAVKIGFSLEEYKAAEDAHNILMCAVSIEELKEHVLGNYREWENEMLGFAVDNMIFRDSAELHFQRITATRRLVNLLTTTRMYIDQTQKMIKNVFPKMHCEDVSAIFSKQYDSKQAYRFMEALRNYVQHSGFAVHTLIQSTKWQEENGQQKIVFSSIPRITIEELLKDKSFKQKVAIEVSGLEQIDLPQFVREYIAALSEAHFEIRKLINSKVDQAEKLVEEYVERFTRESPNEQPIGLAVLSTKSQEVLEYIPVSDFLVKRRHILIKRIGNLSNLAKWSVVSAN